MTFGEYVLALGIYGAAIALGLWGPYGLVCLALRRWGGRAWEDRP